MLITLRKKEHLLAKMIDFLIKNLGYIEFWAVGAFIFGCMEYFVLRLRAKKPTPMDYGVAIVLTLMSWVSIIIMFIAMGIDYCSYDPYHDDEEEQYE